MGGQIFTLASAAPQKHGHAKRDQADPSRDKKKTRRAEAAGLRRRGGFRDIPTNPCFMIHGPWFMVHGSWWQAGDPCPCRRLGPRHKSELEVTQRLTQRLTQVTQKPRRGASRL